MEYSKEQIGKIIKEERSKLGLSQGMLGEMVGVTGKQISNYESAKQKLIPPMDVLLQMCTAFKCELGHLLGEPEYDSGTKLDTAIEKKLGLTTESIKAIKHLTGDDNSCVEHGLNSENYQRIINTLLSSEAFPLLIESIYNLDECVQESSIIWGNTIAKYGETAFNEAYALYRSKDFNPSKEFEVKNVDNSDKDKEHPSQKTEETPDPNEQYGDIIKSIDEIIDKQASLSYRQKVLRYELRESFERLIDLMYPKTTSPYIA